MRRRRRNARFRFEEDVDVQTEAMREINPRIVIGDDVLAFERQHGSAPFLQLGVDGRFKFFVVRFVNRRISRIDCRECLCNVLRHRFGNDRVSHEMWIAERVDVAGPRVAFAGTFINRRPSAAITRPGLPASIFGLRAFCKSGGSQPISNSAPPSINTSAVRNCTTKLGRASTKCGSSVGFARTMTSTLSPPISRASEPKSGRVATTSSFAWLLRAQLKITERIKRIFFMI